ncbi:MAG TPA: LysR family transcriptional regulator [Xanthobacteraceae bacterium]|jgi:DNA-binding transcriptional LysR family regulator
MDRLQELAVLVAVVDHGSLAAAARRLRRSPPAVTRALSALEDRVGVRLIERTTRRLAATEAGRAMAERARGILDDYDHALTGLAEAPLRGLLRVTAPLQFGRRHMAPLVIAFLDAFPEMQVELMLNDRNLELIEEGIDAALRIGPLADSGLLARRVGEVRSILVASPAYLERRGTPKRPADLADHDTIFGSARAEPSEWRFGPGRRASVVRLAPRLMVNEVEARLVAVRAGQGIARVLSYQVSEELEAGSLVRLLAAYEPPALPVHLVAASRGHRAPKVQAFLDFAAKSLGKLRVIRPLERRPKD